MSTASFRLDDDLEGKLDSVAAARVAMRIRESIGTLALFPAKGRPSEVIASEY